MRALVVLLTSALLLASPACGSAVERARVVVDSKTAGGAGYAADLVASGADSKRGEIMESVAIIKRVEDDWVDLLKVRVVHGGGEVVALLAFKDDPE